MKQLKYALRNKLHDLSFCKDQSKRFQQETIVHESINYNRKKYEEKIEEELCSVIKLEAMISSCKIID